MCHNQQEVSELDLKPLQLSWQTATTAALRVQGSHWTVSLAEDYISPVRTDKSQNIVAQFAKKQLALLL